MARTISITDNVSTIQLVRTDSQPSSLSATANILKSSIENICIVSSTDIALVKYDDRPNEYINWTEVSSPAVVSLSDLYSQVLAMWLNVPSSGVFALSSTFTNADLVAGVLSRTHPYATNNIVITVFDPTGLVIVPTVTAVTPITSPASFTLDFGGAIGAGTYSYTLVANP